MPANQQVDQAVAWFCDHAEPTPEGDSTVGHTVRRFRDMISEGAARPGHHLREQELSEALRISRNTLREAFRLLAHEGLVVHLPNRGVFVRRLTPSDIIDIYQVRRLIELDAVRRADAAPRPVLAHLAEIVTDAEQAAADQRWPHVATANIRWHQALTQLSGSRRLQHTMARVLAELRLAFDAYGSPDRQGPFHHTYVAWNRQITDLIAAGRTSTAEQELAAYLAKAERQLLNAHEDT